MSTLWITLGLILIATYLFYKYVTRNYNYWHDKNVACTPPVFPFGHFQNVLLGRESLGVFLQKIHNAHSAEIAGFYIFQKPYLLVRSPEIIKSVLVKEFARFNDRNVFTDHKIDPIGTKTLFLLPNPEWKPTRAKVTPFFTTSKMKNMLKLIAASCDEMVEYLGGDCAHDAKEVCAKFTTDVISNCAFGVKSFCFENENAPFRMIGRRMFGITLLNGFTFISYFLMPALVKIFKLPVYDKSCTDFLKTVFWKAIEEREESKSQRNDLIDIIIQLKKQGGIADGFDFEGDTVVAQALQFYIAGFETTSSTLSMILYELCLRTDIQIKLREEILTEKDKTGELNYENLAALTYMDKVINETLRMFPPFPFLDRKCQEDYKIDNSDVVIEKGTPVYISMLGLHYDPQYFPNPHVFDPERFSEVNSAGRPAYSYMPFGHGPRNCIGERFGIMTVKMGLVKILQAFSLEKTRETPEELVFNPITVLLQPLHDLPINFIPRKQH